MKELYDALDLLNEIEKKFIQNSEISIDELEKLFSFYQIQNNTAALSDDRFDYMNFRHLYLIYSRDFNFNSTFYKSNPSKNVSEYVDFKKLKQINKKEYNPDNLKALEDFYIANELVLPIENAEIEKDKLQLEKSAKDWAPICLNERHSNPDLIIIAKETRDTLKKKNIEDYLSNKLLLTEQQDIFIGLMKSYYVFHEAKKIIDKIDLNKEPKTFTLNSVLIEINFYSYVHIINRHFAEMLSSQSIVNSKSFHNTKIEPYHINLFIEELFRLIKLKGLENKVEIKKGEEILIKYHETDYVLGFDEYKLDKSKIILNTFFIIESGIKYAQRLINKIEASTIVKLNDDLSIYLKE